MRACRKLKVVLGLGQTLTLTPIPSNDACEKQAKDRQESPISAHSHLGQKSADVSVMERTWFGPKKTAFFGETRYVYCEFH